MAGNARADSPVDRVYAEYNFSLYEEEDLDSEKGLPGGETSRYEIDMHQLSVQVPINDRWDVAVEVVHESMTGASPWYTVPEFLLPAPVGAIQVMSGATIEDDRTDVLVHANKYYDNARLGFGTGFSTENDYQAINLSIDGETHFNEKNTTLSGGFGMSFDSIEPTDADLFATRPDDEDKQSYTMFVGFSQILGRKSTVQTSATYRHARGYLDDPYKQAFVIGGAFVPDQRPDTRNQFTWLSRFRSHVEELGGTMHADYRLYADDWGIVSHTIDLAWHQKVRESITVIPSLRYYTQGEADFYAPYFAVAPADEGSSDYRLSAYGAVTLGVQVEWRFRNRWTGDRDWRATLGWESYVSSEDLAYVGDPEENPGLASWDVLSVGLGMRW